MPNRNGGRRAAALSSVQSAIAREAKHQGQNPNEHEARLESTDMQVA